MMMMARASVQHQIILDSVFIYFLFIFFRFFLRRWMVRLILARWIQLDPRALDLFDC
jgi:hypothetical protein